MLRKLMIGGLAASGVVLAGSGASAALFYGDEMERARDMQVQETSFEGYLAREYRDFFLFEADEMYDWIDADYFAEKALAAGGGQAVAPESPADWNVSGDELQELRAGRADLMAAFDQGARRRAPEAAAIAQTKYDCWVEQQEEGHQPAHIAACRDQFATALTALRAELTAAAPQPEAAPQETRMVVGEELAKTVLYFQFDKAKVMAGERAKLDTFVEEMKGLEDVVVFVEGHADRAGPRPYNEALSEDRAQAVRATLISEGITVGDLDAMKTAAKGETEPAVATGDGVREQANRRVEVVARGMYAEEVPAEQ